MVEIKSPWSFKHMGDSVLGKVEGTGSRNCPKCPGNIANKTQLELP
jgi:hypothetical protein